MTATTLGGRWRSHPADGARITSTCCMTPGLITSQRRASWAHRDHQTQPTDNTVSHDQTRLTAAVRSHSCSFSPPVAYRDDLTCCDADRLTATSIRCVSQSGSIPTRRLSGLIRRMARRMADPESRETAQVLSVLRDPGKRGRSPASARVSVCRKLRSDCRGAARLVRTVRDRPERCFAMKRLPLVHRPGAACRRARSRRRRHGQPSRSLTSTSKWFCCRVMRLSRHGSASVNDGRCD